MAFTDYSPVLRGMSRVFLIEGRARPDHELDYQGCMITSGIDQSLGDVTNIKCPSPDAQNKWDVVGQFQGEEGRPSTTLTALYPLDIVSMLERLKRSRCPYDVHINLGSCSLPTDGSVFQKKIIWENAVSTSYGTDDLGAMEETDQSKVNETTDVSAQEFYSVIPLTIKEVGGAVGSDVVTNPLNDVVICSRPECGDCDDEDDGCAHIYAVSDSGPGSPGTGPDLIYTTNHTAELAADDIGTLTDAQDADAVACVGDYVVVVSHDVVGIHYKLQADIDAGTAGGWVLNATNFDAAGFPNDIWSVGQFAFIVGDAGHIYSLSNPVAGVVLVDNGEATTENLIAVHALNKNFAVAVGVNGVVVTTSDQATWAAVTVVTGTPNLTSVWIKDKRTWWVGAGNGDVFYTLDAGGTWTEYTNFPVTLAAVYDIFFHNDSVGYIVGVVGTTGGILRTFSNGGTQTDAWVALPETGGTLPGSTQINAGAACKHDPNFAVFVGAHANDGVYLVGT